ncbi:MAG TPA: adenylate/guanylate cyclase domain-containing protein, partial [Candidatus Limnocylindria bacterium]|nr:adenylate/guanylate cyclase domain-containing protein [Candidatus Limnocylindria bacterium]
MSVWHCAACGGENPERMRFCGHCGTPRAAAGEARPPAEPPRAQPMRVTPEGSGAPSDEVIRSFVAGQVADRMIESGRQLTEERRLVTSLFADLSGFTPLAERLDAEELLGVIDPIINTMAEIVGRYGGFVEKFAGDALLALFGAPVSHEDDAARALLAALEMHRELGRVCQRIGDEAAGLTLHVGVSTGHGIARMIGGQVRLDYAVLGDSVILAQRLESAAPPGETYVAEATYRLAGQRFDFEPLEPLSLKGKSEPVPAFRLVGERRSQDAAQSAIGMRTHGPLVGRARELATLTGVVDALVAGSGGAAAVIGEPGVGKSRLTEEVREHAIRHGVRWLEARCLSYGAGLAYWPFADLIRRFAQITATDDPPAARARLDEAMANTDVAAAVPLFARLLGISEAAAGELEPEAYRRELHGATTSWLRALAADSPVALAIEDVHWIDPSSASLVAELHTELGSDRVLLYLSSRADVRDEIGAMLSAGEREGSSPPVVVMLEPLDEAAMRELARDMLGGDPPTALIPMLADRGGGNPFFVEETIRSLQESGGLEHDDEGGWRLRPGFTAGEVPISIEGVLAARIDSLSPEAASVLGVASVVGRRARLLLLEAVADEPSGITSAVAQLVSAGMLDPASDGLDDAVAFHHALVQDVAYSRLLRRRRRELHQRTAEVAEELYGAGDDVIDLLARHLYLADAGPKAVDYLVRAGERARRLFANEEAIVHFGRAVELSRREAAVAHRLPDLLLTVADLHELTGSYDEALRLYEDARDRTGDVRAWRGIVSTLRREGRYDEAISAADEALAGADGSVDTRALWLERGWTLSVRGDVADAIAALETGLELAAPPDAVTGALLLQLARAETLRGASETALQHATEARRLFETTDDQRGLATALRIIGDVADDLGRLDEAAAALRTGLEVALRVGNAEEIGSCLVNLGFVEQRRGNLAEAIECDLRAV